MNEWGQQCFTATQFAVRKTTTQQMVKVNLRGKKRRKTEVQELKDGKGDNGYKKQGGGSLMFEADANMEHKE